MDIQITKVNDADLKSVPDDYSKLAFGQNFTDHMLIMRYTKKAGWSPAEICPYGDIKISPAASVLHYGQEIFEGMKAYKTPEGKIQLFRPELNFQRMNNSATRMCMATMDVDYILSSLMELLKIEERWIPSKKGTALYIRPTMIASEPFLGVHPAEEYTFFIILSPVGSYFKNGEITLLLKGITLQNGHHCALIGYDSGASSFKMILHPVPNMEIVSVGSSHYWGDISKSLSGNWVQQATLTELVITETTLPMPPYKINAVIEREILIRNVDKEKFHDF